MEIAPPVEPVPRTLATIWRHHEAVSFDGFQQQFLMNVAHEKKFPIIAAVLKNESSLPKIKYIVDILAWQAVAFKVSYSTIIVILIVQ